MTKNWGQLFQWLNFNGELSYPINFPIDRSRYLAIYTLTLKITVYLFQPIPTIWLLRAFALSFREAIYKIMMFSHSSQVFTIKVLSWKIEVSRDPNVIILVGSLLLEGGAPQCWCYGLVWCGFSFFPFAIFRFHCVCFIFFGRIVLHQVVVESPQVKRCAPEVEYVFKKCVKHRNIHWNHHLLHPVSSYYILLHERRCLRRRSPSLEAGISRSQAPVALSSQVEVMSPSFLEWAASFLAFFNFPIMNPALADLINHWYFQSMASLAPKRINEDLDVFLEAPGDIGTPRPP